MFGLIEPMRAPAGAPVQLRVARAPDRRSASVEAAHLDRDRRARAGAVRLDVGDRARIDARGLQAAPDRFGLRLRIGRREADGAAAGADAGALDRRRRCDRRGAAPRPAAAARRRRRLRRAPCRRRRRRTARTRPVADRMPSRPSDAKRSGSRIRFTPPTIATRHSPALSARQARCSAVPDDEHAVSTARLGPWKPRSCDRRFARLKPSQHRYGLRRRCAATLAR